MSEVVNEIAYVDPGFMLVDKEKFVIPAGTISVIPHAPEEFIDDSVLPHGTIFMAGQELERSLYRELSQLHPDSGSFYYFMLPDLRKKFIIGFNPDENEIQWGDGVIYYQSIPPK